MAAKQSGRHRSRRARSASSRPTWFYLVLAGIAAAGVGGLAWVAFAPRGSDDLTPRELPADLAGLGPAQPYVKGDTTAPVEILEFADFECPSCAHYAILTAPDVRTRIVEGGRAYLKYYDLPLPQHRHSQPASHAAACADEQGLFWEMHDRLYLNQERWATNRTSNPRSIFRDLAREVGSNVGQWEQCYDSRRSQQRIDANHAEAVRRGVNSTPTFIINGQVMRGAVSYDQLNAAVTAAMERPRGGDTAAK